MVHETYLHVIEEVIPFIEADDESRIKFVEQDKWIGYPEADKILAKLEELLNLPRRSRMPNLLIYGESNNGKTSLIEEFLRRHPPQETANLRLMEVVLVDTPDTPNVLDLYDEILFRIKAPIPKSRIKSQRKIQIIQTLKKINTRILAIDEFQDILVGKGKQPQNFLIGIKKLGNALKIPIILLGTTESLAAIQVDNHVRNRFQEMPLPRWGYSEGFRQLLASFEMMLPFKRPSFLQEPSFAQMLHEKSEGTIGGLADLLREGAKYAIRNKYQNLEKVIFTEKIKWVPPSQRKVNTQRTIDNEIFGQWT